MAQPDGPADELDAALVDEPGEAPRAVVMKDLQPGTVWAGRYRIISIVGRGGLGTVYKAFDTIVQRNVALKILPRYTQDEDFRRSLNEAVLARLHHPNILRLFEHGDIDGSPFVTTQFVDGRSLDQILRNRGRLEPDYAIEIIVRVGTALTFAHWQGVIHRDIKPSNILVSRDGDVLLADFGLADRSGESTLTSSGTVVGTPAYMSPEQARGEPVDARSDIFALGAVFYETLTGRKWFARGGESIHTGEMMQRVVEQEPRPIGDLVSGLPPRVALAILKALAKDPSDRFQSAADFVSALLPIKAVPLGLLAGADVQTGAFPSFPSSPALGLSPRTGFRRGSVALLSVALLLMLAASPIFFVRSLDRQTAAPSWMLLGVMAIALSGILLLSHRWLRLRADAEAEARGDTRIERLRPVDDDQPTVDVPAYLPQSERRLREFAQIWDDLVQAAQDDKQRFGALIDALVRGPLREAIGYRLGDHIPYFQGTAGYMVEAPFLWIRQSWFPILFVASDSGNPDQLSTVVHQLAVARTTEFFALLVVVPPHGATTGREAEQLRRLVADSVYCLDFVVLDREQLGSIIAHNSSRRLIEIILEQVDDLSVLSPYVVRGPVPGKMFFGRESEIKTISQSIRRGDYAVVGGRRIGKSSVLLRLTRLLGDDARYRTIYIDCEAHFTDDDFFAAVREHVDGLADSDQRSFRQLVTRLQEASSPRQVVFLLDEIDELLAFDAERRPAGRLFKTLRAASQEGACRFVFSGSRTLSGHLRDSRSPFFNFCEAITLGRLEEQSVSEIVRKPMHQLGIDMADEERLIARLIELSSCHPNIAQWVCDRLVRSSVERRITSQELEGVATLGEFYEQYVSTAWGDATALEKLISLVMSEPSFTWDDVLKALEAHGLHDKNAIRDALNFLELCSLLERDATHYRFALAQFPRIVRESGIVSTQIESLASEARTQCS